MADLVERYVHQVGRYLPKKERADIEAELRSQIHDQLDDRYGVAPSPEDIVTVLSELGDPREMAASYNRDQYLVGPDLYPYMMLVLRHGWLIVPSIVIFLNLFRLLVSAEPPALPALFSETVIGVVQTTLIFSAIVVLIFAAIQHSNVQVNQPAFNPSALPEVSDPRTVDRFETVFALAFGTVVMLIFVYFLHVGGLTLRFDLSNPGEVIPVPLVWLVLLIVSGTMQILLHLLVLRRNRWSIGAWLVQSGLELLGIFCLYLVLFKPLVERIVATNPALAGITALPEILAAGMGIMTLIGKSSTLVRLWSYRPSEPPYAAEAGR